MVMFAKWNINTGLKGWRCLFVVEKGYKLSSKITVILEIILMVWFHCS